MPLRIEADDEFIVYLDGLARTPMPSEIVERRLIPYLFPESRRVSDTSFRLPAKPFIASQLQAIDGMVWSIHAKNLADRLQREHDQAMALQSRPFAKVPTVIQVKKVLRPYQTLAVDFGLRINRFILTLECGLGKTLVALYLALCKIQSGAVKRCLIVLTNAALKQFVREFEGIRDVEYQVIGRDDHDPQYMNHLPFTMVTYDQLISHTKRGYVSFDQLKQFDMVIMDEPKRLSNADTVTYEFCRSAFESTEHMVLLNATPIENRLRELWTMVDFVRPGFLSTWRDFASRYAGASKKVKIKPLVGDGSLHSQLASVMFRRNKDDVGEELPERIYKTITVDLTPIQQKMYREARDTDTEIYSLYTKLQKICDDPWLLGHPTHDTEKLRELDDVVAGITQWGSKGIVFAESRPMIDHLAERYAKHGCVLYHGGMSRKQKDAAEESFASDPSLHLFICTSAGFRALNMPYVSYVVKLHNLWCNMRQIEDRAHRLDSQHPVTIVSILTSTPFEQYKSEVVERKEALQQAVVENLPDAIRAGVVELVA